MSIFDNEEIYAQVLGGAIQASLDLAAEADDMTEREAISSVAETVASWNVPTPMLAFAYATLAVRMRRTQQLAAAVNSPEPGPSPE